MVLSLRHNVSHGRAPAIVLLSAALGALIGSRPAFAEEHFADPHSLLSLHSYDTADGLPSSSVSSVVQHTDGYLWVGTASGLVRFDGNRFVTWGYTGESSLPSNDIRVLLSANDGSIWIGLGIGGISRLQNGRLTNFSHERFAGDRIETLLEDRHGAVWAGGRSGLALFRNDRWHYLGESDGMPEVAVYSIYEDRNGSLWVSTYAGVFCKRNGSDRFEFVSVRIVRQLAGNATGTVWMTGPSGTIGLDDIYPARQPKGHIEGDGEAILEDSQGGLWVGTRREGLTYVARAALTGLTRVRSRHWLRDRRISAITEDREGQIWVATRSGLFRLFRRRVSMVALAAPEPAPIRSVQPADDGSVWVGTSDGLKQVTGSDSTEFTVRHTAVTSEVFSMWGETAAALWLGTGTGIAVLRHDRILQWPGRSFKRAFQLVVSKGGDAWFCQTSDASLYYWPGRHGEAVQVETANQSACTSIYLDESDRIWVGLGDGTVTVHEPQEPQRRRLVGNAGGRVCAMHEDTDGSMWIATAGGLGHVRNGQLHMIADSNGLPGRSLRGLVEDREGQLWFGVDSGLVRVAKPELERAIRDSSYRVRYDMFDSSDGLVGQPSCSFSRSAALGSDGRVWFVTGHGLAVVDPTQAAGPISVIVPDIIRVTVNDRTAISPSDGTRLPSGTSTLRIEYGAISLSSASKVRFQYKLEGFDDNWVDAGTERQAVYADVPSGGYRFLVRASLNGVDHATKAWAFAIQPAFYETQPFYLTCLGLVAGGAWRAWRRRLTRMRHEFALITEERTRIARALHDTVLQSMAGTALQIESIAIDNPSSVTAEELRRLRRKLEHDIIDARRTIQQLRSPAIESYTLQQSLEQFADALATDTVKVRVVVMGSPWSFTPEVQEHLLRIGQEAISNALRHGAPSHVRIVLHYEVDAFRLRIVDDGRGFDVEQLLAQASGHWGLKGMLERANRVGGRISIRRVMPGIEVEVCVPRD